MKLFTSRSAIETYLSSCQYKAALAYHFKGKGISPKETSIDLVCGSAFHLGVEKILSGMDYSQACNLALEYFDDKELKDRQVDSDDLLEYSIKEHKWLVNALLYAWYVSEYKLIQEEYEIVSSEREVVNEFVEFPTAAQIEKVFLASRVDALLWHKETEELHTYSVKTTKQLGFFSEAMQNRDLQGYLEIWATEEWLKGVKEEKSIVLASMRAILDDRAFAKFEAYLEKKIPPVDKVSAVRFCFAVKGQRREDKRFIEDYPLRINPYIYGYRKLLSKDNNTYEYAHSFQFSNTSNQSGQGRLGKGWEKFSIAEGYPGGIESWIDNINSGAIQPEAENPINDIIYVAEPTRRIERFLNENVANAKEAEIEKRLKLEQANTTSSGIGFGFLANLKSCSQPLPCEYLPVCKYGGQFNQNTWDDLFDLFDTPSKPNDLYQIRVSHHEPERKEMEKG